MKLFLFVDCEIGLNYHGILYVGRYKKTTIPTFGLAEDTVRKMKWTSPKNVIFGFDDGTSQYHIHLKSTKQSFQLSIMTEKFVKLILCWILFFLLTVPREQLILQISFFIPAVTFFMYNTNSDEFIAFNSIQFNDLCLGYKKLNKLGLFLCQIVEVLVQAVIQVRCASVRLIVKLNSKSGPNNVLPNLKERQNFVEKAKPLTQQQRNKIGRNLSCGYSYEKNEQRTTYNCLKYFKPVCPKYD